MASDEKPTCPNLAVLDVNVAPGEDDGFTILVCADHEDWALKGARKWDKHASIEVHGTTGVQAGLCLWDGSEYCQC